VLFVPRGSSFRSTMVLGVRESNLYRMKGQPMRAMVSSSKVTMVRERVPPEIVQIQRESDLIRSLPLGSNGREASSKTDRKVSWVEEAKQEAQKREASGSNVSSQEGPCHTTGFVSLTEGASN